MNNSEKENITTELLSRVDSFGSLMGNIHLLGLSEEACDGLAFDLLQCQESVIGGMKIMGKLFQEQACQMRRNGSSYDDYGDSESLDNLGEYLDGSARLLAGLSAAITELSAQTAFKK